MSVPGLSEQIMLTIKQVKSRGKEYEKNEFLL
jgi:hypothetical protein